MVPLGLPAIWNTTKHGPCAKFQTRILLFFLGIYSNKHPLLCVTAPKKTKVLIKQKVSSDRDHVWLKCCSTHSGSINLMRACSSLFALDFISSITPGDLLLLYNIYCGCFAQIRNLTNSIRLQQRPPAQKKVFTWLDFKHEQRSHSGPMTHNMIHSYSQVVGCVKELFLLISFSLNLTFWYIQSLSTLLAKPNAI